MRQLCGSLGECQLEGPFIVAIGPERFQGIVDVVDVTVESFGDGLNDARIRVSLRIKRLAVTDDI